MPIWVSNFSKLLYFPFLFRLYQIIFRYFAFYVYFEWKFSVLRKKGDYLFFGDNRLEDNMLTLCGV